MRNKIFLSSLLIIICSLLLVGKSLQDISCNYRIDDYRNALDYNDKSYICNRMSSSDKIFIRHVDNIPGTSFKAPDSDYDRDADQYFRNTCTKLGSCDYAIAVTIYFTVNKIRIVTGSGISRYITSSVKTRMIQDIGSYARNNNFRDAYGIAIQDVHDRYRPGPGPGPGPSPHPGSSLAWWIIMLICFGGCFFCIILGAICKACGNGGSSSYTTHSSGGGTTYVHHSSNYRNDDFNNNYNYRGNTQVSGGDYGGGSNYNYQGNTQVSGGDYGNSGGNNYGGNYGGTTKVSGGDY